VISLLIITFRKLTQNDLNFLLRCLEYPHVKLWWDKDIKWTYDLIKEKYTTYTYDYKLKNNEKKSLQAYIIVYNNQPIGYIQYYFWNDFNEKNILDRAASFDWYIGEMDYLGKGLSTKILNQFIREIINSEFIVVECEIANVAAIKCYEKVGLKKTKT
jgi:aminoglycoside 6'-N-acetyltransferase